MGPLFAKPRLVGKCRLGRWGVNLVEANRRVNLVELKLRGGLWPELALELLEGLGPEVLLDERPMMQRR